MTRSNTIAIFGTYPGCHRTKCKICNKKSLSPKLPRLYTWGFYNGYICLDCAKLEIEGIKELIEKYSKLLDEPRYSTIAVSEGL